jgi:hypothetical protein
MLKKTILAAVVLGSVLSGAAQAATFNMGVGATGIGNVCGAAGNSACGNGTEIPDSFGDTPAVDFGYQSLSSAGGGQTATPGGGVGVGFASPRYWTSGYSGGPGIWSGSSDSSSAVEVTVDLAPGFNLDSVTFNLGGYPNVNRTTNWAVYDTSGTIWMLLNSASLVTVSGTTGLAIVLSGLSNVQSVALQFWNSAFNVGLTSVSGNYSAVSAVPVPAALPLLISALAGAGFMARRRKKVARAA